MGSSIVLSGVNRNLHNKYYLKTPVLLAVCGEAGCTIPLKTTAWEATVLQTVVGVN